MCTPCTPNISILSWTKHAAGRDYLGEVLAELPDHTHVVCRVFSGNGSDIWLGVATAPGNPAVGFGLWHGVRREILRKLLDAPPKFAPWRCGHDRAHRRRGRAVANLGG
jgi:hypothetical protein